METSQLRSTVDICQMQGDDETTCELGWTKSNLLDTDETQNAAETTANTGQKGLVVTLGNSPTIKAVLGGDAATQLKSKHVTWAKIDGAWSCTSNIEQKYLTKGCQHKDN
ncbi:pilin [Moraxella nasovis]|nr:pilin [Moraxella nasovis]